MFNPVLVISACVVAVISTLGMRFATGTPKTSSPAFKYFFAYITFMSGFAVFLYFENYSHFKFCLSC